MDKLFSLTEDFPKNIKAFSSEGSKSKVTNVKEQSVSEFLDIGFVNCCDLFAVISDCVVKGESSNAFNFLACNDLKM